MGFTKVGYGVADVTFYLISLVMMIRHGVWLKIYKMFVLQDVLKEWV